MKKDFYDLTIKGKMQRLRNIRKEIDCLYSDKLDELINNYDDAEFKHKFNENLINRVYKEVRKWG